MVLALKMFKKNYVTKSSSPTICRSVLQILFAPLFLLLHEQAFVWPSYTWLIGCCYITSFCYHRLSFGEAIFRFLDYMIILTRFIVMSRYLPLGISLLIPPSIQYGLVLTRSYDRYQYYKWFTRYYLFVILFLGTIACFKMEIYRLLLVSMFIPTGLCFALKPRMPWHSKKWWSHHDDFHLILLLTDLFMVFIARNQDMLELFDRDIVFSSP